MAQKEEKRNAALERIKEAKRVVVKIGSSSLTDGGRIAPEKIKALAEELANRNLAGVETILVSSGAIASGWPALGLARKPEDLASAQAAAAVGQGILMAHYHEAFGELGVKAGQVLLTAGDLRKKKGRQNARRTLLRLLELKAIPIINENDTVATEEIRFGDNDNLAALVAVMIEADALILLSDVGGVYSADPKKIGAKHVPFINKRTQLKKLQIQGGGGTGGMESKVAAALLANSQGIPAVIAEAGEIGSALSGGGTGTLINCKN